jgi:pimeloyl-ACP methyl ester carboxylesterase
VDRKVFFVGVIALIWVALCVPFSASAQTAVDYGSNDAVGQTVSVNGVEIYYEIYGEGQPVLVLHGGGDSIAAMSNQIAALQDQFQVIAVDTRAHGKSTDAADVPLSYELFASDMVGLLDALEIDSVYVVGFSDGANTGLAMAFLYPDRIEKLVAIGANYAPDNTAVYDEVLAVVNGALALDDLPDAQRKLMTLWVTEPNYTIEQLNSIQIPVLVIAADHDVIREEHTVKLFQSIPQASLFIVPGATHLAPMEKPELIDGVIVDFLTSPYEAPDRFSLFG